MTVKHGKNMMSSSLQIFGSPSGDTSANYIFREAEGLGHLKFEIRLHPQTKPRHLQPKAQILEDDGSKCFFFFFFTLFPFHVFTD